MGALNGLEDSPVSFATVGAGVGMFLGPGGLAAGMLIGAIADVFIGAGAKKKARKKAERAYFAHLMKRYNNTIFITTLERIGAAMMFAQSLGLKPGSPEYDAFLTKKLRREIGYKGKCDIDLYSPAKEGQVRKVVASIDRHGRVKVLDGHFDQSLGPKWAEACKEIHKAALQMWAEEKKEEMEYAQEIQEERTAAQRNTFTRLLVNGGIIMLMIGYTVRQKKKLKALRQRAPKRRKKKPRRKKRTGN